MIFTETELTHRIISFISNGKFNLGKEDFVCNRGDTILCSWWAPANKKRLRELMEKTKSLEEAAAAAKAKKPLKRRPSEVS